MTRVLILRSEDGQDYAMAVLIPESMDLADAYDLAEQAIESTRDTRPEEWGYDEHILPALLKAGFLDCVIVRGPTWDMG